MTQTALLRLLSISVTSGMMIVAVRLFSKKLNKAFDARWKYWVWLLLALRLLIPFGIPLPSAPVTVTLPPPAAMPAAAQVAAHAATPVSQAFPKPPGTEAILTAVWIAGASFFLGKQLLGYFLQRRRLLRWSRPMQSETILAQVRMEQYILGISRRVDVLECKNIASPMMIGFFHAKLFLPVSVHERTHAQVDFVLRHEFIHMRRNDLWYKLFLTLANAVHWFNPLVYLMVRQASADLEISCDAAVVKGTDAEMRRAYGETILSFAPVRGDTIQLSTHFGGGPTMIKERFDHIFSMQKKKKGVVLFLALMLIVGIAGSLISTRNRAVPQSGVAQLAETWKAQYGNDERWTPNGAMKEMYPEPGDSDFPQEDALRLAIETVMKATGKGVEAMEAYQPSFQFSVFEDGRREWQVGLYPTEDTGAEDGYAIHIDSPSGKVTYYQFGGRG